MALLVTAPGIRAQPGDEALEVIQLTAAPSVRLSSAALLVSDMSGGDLEVSRLVAPLPSIEEETSVLMLFTIEPAALKPGLGPLDLEIAAYALTAANEVAAGTATEIRLAAPAARRGLQVALTLPLPAGDYRLRTLVRDRTSGALDLSGEGLRVPAPSRAGCAAWFQHSGASRTLAVPDPTTAALLRSGPRVAAPRPSLSGGQAAAVRLVRPPASPAREAPVASIATGEGTVLAALQLAVEAAPLATPGFEVYDLVFEVPDLAAGSYLLRFASGGDVGGNSACAEVDFSVPPGAPSPTDANGAPTPLAESSWTDPAPVPGYLDVLRTLAAGDLARARAELRALESAIQQEAGDRGLLRFVRGEQQVVGRIARREPAALQSLVLLHAELLAEYHAAAAKVLEADTASTIEILARALARHAEPGEQRQTASRALTLAASLLQRSGWHDASDRVYAVALALDGTNAEARLGAAAGREKAEDYRAVVALLAPLADARPVLATAVSDQARLRWALNQIRIGNQEPGAETLRELAARSGAEWVSILAFQELARLQPEPGPGAVILRQGLARWPGERGLLIQLAHLLEGDQTAAATLELLQPLLGDSPPGPSPRARYNAWPRPGDPEPSGLEELSLWLAAEGGAR
jgi:hypothetical protein